jgi:hypothetical protein
MRPWAPCSPSSVTEQVAVRLVLARVSKRSIERATMAILPWRCAARVLERHHVFPQLTLWLPRVMGMIK